MKGEPRVIEYLNSLLAGELTAIDQYFIHSRMYANWGLNKLADRVGHEMADETGHADILIKRMLFLEGMPDLSKREPLRIGRDVPEMLQNDLNLEYSVIVSLKEAIAHCESVRDFETRELLEGMLTDTEEDHAFWLEQQIGLIARLGLANYLQSQIG